MNKKIKTALTALMLCCAQTISVFATDGYYVPRERKSISPEELSYSEFDSSRMDLLISRMENIIYFPGHDEEIRAILENCYDEFLKAERAHIIAGLNTDRLYNEENMSCLTAAAEKMLNASQSFLKLTEKVYKSDYSYILGEIIDLNPSELEEFMDSIPSDKFYELSKEEDDLAEQYSSVYGDNEASAELYVRLVKVRNKIAEEQGFGNYAEYANEMIYNRSYSEEDIKEYSDSVIEYICPLIPLMGDVMQQSLGYSVPRSEEETIRRVGKAVTEINAELGEGFDYMLENGLLDASYSEEKSPSSGAYTTNIPGINVPYIFINPSFDYNESCVNGAGTLIHEFGHFSAMLNEPQLDNKWRDFSNAIAIDTCELHSQGLEMLMQRYYGRIYGKEASDERLLTTALVLSNVIDGCSMNEWQAAVYKEPDITVEKCDELAAEVIKKYYGVESDPEKSRTFWTGIPHNFVSPMYYISYSVSAAAALELLVMADNNYAAAVDKYMKLSALGTYMPFDIALEYCLMSSVFNREVIKGISEGVKNHIIMTFSDVQPDDWFTNYLYQVRDIFDGIEYNTFCPDEAITRADFAELVGKMYDEYVGIEGDYTISFSDIDADSECAGYIAWANDNGIIKGYSESEFGADDTITREQLVTILFRLAQFENSESTGYRSSIERFSDYTKVSDYAQDALGWAVNSKLISGRDDGTIDPQGNTTRAEAAKLASCYIDLLY